MAHFHEGRAYVSDTAGVAGNLTCVVAVPVRNEEESINACLDALDGLRGRQERACHVLLVLNGCTDGTWDRAVAWSQDRDLPLSMVQVTLAPAFDHAGGARTCALELALAMLDGREGIVLTTDADSRVSLDWLDHAASALAAGCDVVAGDIFVDERTAATWPPHLRHRHGRETVYTRLLDEIDAICDPLPHNPWPTHRRCSGANLVFRASALRKLSPLPAPPCGEDRALVAACVAKDLRVRFHPHLRVETSGRLEGRASDGMADTLRQRATVDTLPCDVMLEPCAQHVLRASLRASARALFVPGMTDASLALSVGLISSIDQPEPCRHFGEAWQRVERLTPQLAPVALSPGSLDHEIENARAWLANRALAPSAEIAA